MSGTKDFLLPTPYGGAISDSLQIRNALKIASVTLNSLYPFDAVLGEALMFTIPIPNRLDSSGCLVVCHDHWRPGCLCHSLKSGMNQTFCGRFYRLVCPLFFGRRIKLLVT